MSLHCSYLHSSRFFQLEFLSCDVCGFQGATYPPAYTSSSLQTPICFHVISLQCKTGECGIVTPLDLLMACVWHMQPASPATSTPLGVSSSSSSVLQGASFLPSVSPPVRHLATFATPPLSHPHATSPFGAKSFRGHETGNSSSSHVGHSFMGLPRKVSVYDSSGAYVMACDCAC